MSVAEKREKIITYIKTNVRDISGLQFDKVYDIVCAAMGENAKGDTPRRDKIIYIETNVEYVDKKNLAVLNDVVRSYLEVKTPEEKRLKVTLEIFNKLLAVAQKTQITDLCEFIDFPRSLLVSDECKDVVNKNLSNIFDNGFKKTECKNYCKVVKNPHLSILRVMLRKNGYDFFTTRKKPETNDTKIRPTYYSVKKLK